jgi:hypothetical protein
LIRIENSDAAPPLHKTSAWFPELFSPLRAFGGTRDARADLARVAVDSTVSRVVYGPGCSSQDGACVQFKQYRLKLAHCETTIPLGWSLSDGAKADIRRQLGLESLDTASKCVRMAAKENQENFLEIMNVASSSPR